MIHPAVSYSSGDREELALVNSVKHLGVWHLMIPVTYT